MMNSGSKNKERGTRIEVRGKAKGLTSFLAPRTSLLILSLFTLHPSLLLSETISITVTAPSQQVTVQPQSTVITPEVVTVTATVNVTGTETVEVAVPGPQGIAGTGTGGEAGPHAATHAADGTDPLTLSILQVSGLQSALDTKIEQGQDVTLGNVTLSDYSSVTVGGSGGYSGTNISNAGVDAGFFYGTWFGSNPSDRISGGDLKNMANHLMTMGNAHLLEAYMLPGLAAVALSNDYNDLDNKPVLLRGYDGREIELQTSATHIQWRYLSDPPGPWLDLVSLSTLTGADGANGADGADGKTILSGSGAPDNSLGTNGDYYLDTPASHLYGPKTAGAWGAYVDLVGPQGPPGPSASVTQTAVLSALDDPTDGAVLYVQQGGTESATAAKIAVGDRLGNYKTWLDGNGTVVRQCITADTAAAVTMLSPTGATLYSVTCSGTMTFKGTVTIQ